MARYVTDQERILATKLVLVLDLLQEILDSEATYSSNGDVNFHVPQEVMWRVRNQMRRVGEL